MAATRHSVRGLFARWRRFFPLQQALAQRTFGLLIAAEEHCRWRLMTRGLDGIASVALRITSALAQRHAILLAVLRPRAIRALLTWRQTTYTVLGVQLTIFLARRALEPLEMREALDLWSGALD